MFAHRALVEHEVLQRVLVTEPDILLPRLSTEADQTHTLVAAVPGALPGAPRHGGRHRPRRRGRLPGPHGALLHQLPGALGPQRPRAGGAAGALRAARRHPVSAPSCSRSPSPSRPRRATATPTGPPRCCARHCDRPICTDCMVQAQVGWQCPECTSEGAKRSRHVPAFTHTSRDRTGCRRRPPTRRPVVLAIIAINVVVFFLEGFGTNSRVIDRYGLWPDGVHFYHQYYRAFTAMWLHASFEHIFFNMITLLIVGPGARGAAGQGALHRPVPAGRARWERGLVPPRPAQRARHRGLGRHHGRPGRLHRGGAPSPPAGGAGRHPARHQPGHRLLRATPTGGPTSAGWSSAALLGLLYDYAGDLRDRTTALVLTVGGSVAVLAVLALLITSIAPGHFNLN